MHDAKANIAIRCAIYTRKSTEDGLEQEYNSLDAQYDACASYVTSQRHEGWTLVRDRYDDGGFSGGNMERPGLRRLLTDVKLGNVDTIVIYKVDRLTRSLSDFAKIVEVLDGASASFVSVTQSFNTTTSMGRLMLNVLLSFAQFEREVTGERIRDKIAASKRKGIWMGGPVPLGYDVCARKLIVNDPEAALVNHIFERYLALRSVRELIDELDRGGHRTKIQVRTSGPHRGGVPFRRGTLYHLLSNRIYRGLLVHKGEAHPGEHLPIVNDQLWDDVQIALAARGPGAALRSRAERRSHLAGLLYDGEGRAMKPTHTRKGQRAYRYYASSDATEQRPAWRVRAHDIEQIVAQLIGDLLMDQARLTRMILPIAPRDCANAIKAAATLSGLPSVLIKLGQIGVSRIDLSEQHLSVAIRQSTLLYACGVTPPSSDEHRIILDAPIRRVRRGHELRLVIPGEADTNSERASRVNMKLIKLLAEAFEAREMVFAQPGKSLSEIAKANGRCRTRLGKIIGISFLAPNIVGKIVAGDVDPKLNCGALMATPLPLIWTEQAHLLTQ